MKLFIVGSFSDCRWKSLPQPYSMRYVGVWYDGCEIVSKSIEICSIMKSSINIDCCEISFMRFRIFAQITKCLWIWERTLLQTIKKLFGTWWTKTNVSGKMWYSSHLFTFSEIHKDIIAEVAHCAFLDNEASLWQPLWSLYNSSKIISDQILAQLTLAKGKNQFLLNRFVW